MCKIAFCRFISLLKCTHRGRLPSKKSWLEYLFALAFTALMLDFLWHCLSPPHNFLSLPKLVQLSYVKAAAIINTKPPRCDDAKIPKKSVTTEVTKHLEQMKQPEKGKVGRCLNACSGPFDLVRQNKAEPSAGRRNKTLQKITKL